MVTIIDGLKSRLKSIEEIYEIRNCGGPNTKISKRLIAWSGDQIDAYRLDPNRSRRSETLRLLIGTATALAVAFAALSLSAATDCGA